MLTQYIQSAGKSPQQLRHQQQERRQQRVGGSRSPAEGGEQRSPEVGAAGAGGAEVVSGEEAQPQLGQAEGQASLLLSADPGLLGGCLLWLVSFSDWSGLLSSALPSRSIRRQQSGHYWPTCTHNSCLRAL
jgi:hypothetical protein